MQACKLKQQAAAVRRAHCAALPKRAMVSFLFCFLFVLLVLERREEMATDIGSCGLCGGVVWLAWLVVALAVEAGLVCVLCLWRAEPAG